MIVYHTTSRQRAVSILRDGFSDEEIVRYGVAHVGVLVTRPLPAVSDASHTYLLAVEIADEADCATVDTDVAETDGTPVAWEGIAPAALLNEAPNPLLYVADLAGTGWVEHPEPLREWEPPRIDPYPRRAID